MRVPPFECVKKRLVGADAYIGPFVNVTNSLEIDNNRCFSLWGDVGIAPYDARKPKILTV